jgi:GT2 family glycosyltransferase
MKVTQELVIIIVNWNSGEKIVDCLDSIINSTLQNISLKIVVVDNNSTDGSIRLICNKYPKIEIVINKENIGFGRACNLVLNKISTDFVLLINPDTRVFPETIQSSLKYIIENQDIDVLGVKNYDLNGKVTHSCARFPNTKRLIHDMTGVSKTWPKIFKPGTIMTDWNHLESRFVDHVIGAYMLIRLSTLNKVGFFDDRFFLYLEDLDLSMRIIQAGGKIYYNADISIIHEGGGTSNAIPAKRLFYSLQSRILFCEKYKEQFSLLPILFFSIFIEPIIRILTSFFRFNFRNIIYSLKGSLLYYRWLIMK